MDRIYGKIFSAVFLVLLSASAACAGPLINKYLPPELKVDLEYRYRLEYRSNFDFNESRDDEEAFNLGRTRLNLKYNPIKELGFFFQGQDSRIWEANTVNKALFENYMDIRQLYVNYEEPLVFEPLQMNKFSLRAGRQEFSFGAQRLIGGFNWSNIAQSFDGAKVGFHFVPAHIQFDLFGGEKVLIKSPREGDELFGAAGKDKTWGYYASAKALGETLIENYLIHRETYRNVSFGPSGSSEIDDYTFGGRLKRTFKNGVDYELETAGQWGNFRDKDVQAMMAVGSVGYSFNHLWKPRVMAEISYGSGDTDPTDGTMRTFDNLYPTNHLFYGYMDFISLQNMNEYHYQASVKPHKKLKLQADFYMLHLDTVKDSFYSAARTVTRTATTKVDDHVGNEVDLTMDYKVNDWASVLVGYSHFFAGDYLKETGANDDADFVYLQTTFAL